MDKRSFKAFITYSHDDLEIARRLQAWLEKFRIPPGLPGEGEVLRPIFRDEEELTAGNLSERLYAALDASEALILVASPTAAKSRWVEEEISQFRRKKPNAPCLAIIVGGTPNTAPSDEECFPQALKRAFDSGSSTQVEIEVFAPDIRKFGEEGAFLRVAAGLLGLPLGLVSDRHSARQAAEKRKQQRLTGVAFVEPASRALEAGRHDLALRYVVAGIIAADDPDFQIIPELLLSGTNAASQNRLCAVFHGGKFKEIAMRPDGACVISDSADNTARVWNAKSGREIARLIGHERRVEAIQFSQDGTRIITGSSDTTARVWEADTGRQIAYLVGHRLPVSCVAFSPNGVEVATGSPDYTARIWEINSGTHRIIHPGQYEQVTAISFSPDASLLVTGAHNGRVRIWNARGGLEIATLDQRGSVRAIEFSTDGARMLSWGLDRTARVWDMATLSETACIAEQASPAHLFDAAFDRGGKRVVTATSDQKARIWDAKSGNLITEVGHEGRVRSAVFSPDGNLVATAAADNTARLWGAAEGQQIGPAARHGGEVIKVLYASDGRDIVTVSADNAARTWNVEPDCVFAQIDACNACEFSRDGKQILGLESDFAGKDLLACAWDAGTGQEIARHRIRVDPGRHLGRSGSVGSNSNAWSFAPDGSLVAVALFEGFVQVWNMVTGSEIARMASGHSAQINVVTFSPDAKQVWTASDDCTVRSWDIRTGSLKAVLSGHDQPVNSAMFCPDGTRIVTASDDNTVRVWDSATGAELLRFSGHQIGDVDVWDYSEFAPKKLSGTVHTAVFSSDGARVLTVGADSTARVWSVETGAEILCLNDIGSASLSPNGRRIVTTSPVLKNGIGKIVPSVWEALTGSQVGKLVGHAEEVFTSAFSPDGTLIVTSSADDTVRLWDSETCAQVACFEGSRPRVSPDGSRLLVILNHGTGRLCDIGRIAAFVGPLRIGGIVASLDRGVGAIHGAEKDDLLLAEVPEDLHDAYIKHYGTPEFLESLAQVQAILDRPRLAQDSFTGHAYRATARSQRPRSGAEEVPKPEIVLLSDPVGDVTTRAGRPLRGYIRQLVGSIRSAPHQRSALNLVRAAAWHGVPAIVYAFAFASLAQRVFGLNLSSGIGHVLVLYRDVFHYPFALINSVGFWVIPRWYADSFILSAAIVVTFMHQEQFLHNYGSGVSRPRHALATLLFVLVLSVPLAGLVCLVLFDRRQMVSLLCGVAAAIAFVALDLSI